MEWKSFTYQGKIYPLDHLHPFELIVSQPPKNTKPERTCYPKREISRLYIYDEANYGEEGAQYKDQPVITSIV